MVKSKYEDIWQRFLQLNLYVIYVPVIPETGNEYEIQAPLTSMQGQDLISGILGSVPDTPNDSL